MTLGDMTARRLANVVFISVACAMPVLAGGLAFALVGIARQSDKLKAQLHETTQQNVSARYDACLGGNVLRAALRQEVIDSQAQAPLFFKLVPQLDTPEVRRLAAEGARKKLKAYADQPCSKVALAVVPPAQRRDFHVP